MSEEQGVASLELFVQDTKQNLFSGSVVFHKPRFENGNWRCTVTMPLRDGATSRLVGETSLGALLGALIFVKTYLAGAQKSGVVFYDSDACETAIDIVEGLTIDL